MTTTPQKKPRGFAVMDKAAIARIASLGGKSAHAQGKAHRWTSEEARLAGRKGGAASKRRKAVMA